MADLNNDMIVSDLQAGGIIDKLVTGPWMHLFYKGPDGPTHHLDVVPFVRRSITAIDILIDQPDSLHAAEDIFGSPVKRDEVWTALTYSTDALVFEKVSCMASSIKTIIKRQMSWYLDHDPTEEERDLSASAPLHNIEAERIMAVMDSMKRKSHTASMLNISSRLRAKRCNTLDWLGGLPVDRQEEIVHFSVTRGREFRGKMVERQRGVEEIIVSKVKERQQAKVDKDRRAIERKLKVVIDGGVFNEVFSEGIFIDKEDLVVRVISEPSILVGKQFVQVYLKNNERISYKGKILEVNFYSKTWTYIVVYGDEGNLDLDEFDISLKELLADYMVGDFYTI